MRKLSYLHLLLLGCVIVLIISCEKNSGSASVVEPERNYGKGTFILNEGANRMPSVAFIPDNGDTVEHQIFHRVNSRKFDDGMVDGRIAGDNIYLSFCRPGKIEVVNRHNFKHVATVTGLNRPRYIEVANGKVYASLWYAENAASAVAIINPDTFEEELGRIFLGKLGAEGILYTAQKLWVAFTGAFFDLDSTVYALNPDNLELIESIKVGYGPRKMVVDRNGKLWVLCSGMTCYDLAFADSESDYQASLCCIDPETYEVKSYVIPVIHPEQLDISPDRDILYFGAGFHAAGVYRMSINDVGIPDKPFIKGEFTGFSVNPVNGTIYCMEANIKDEFIGRVGIFAPDGSSVKVLDNIGCYPIKALFN